MRKAVLNTGCPSGLGNTSVKKFAAEGWNVIATMRKDLRHSRFSGLQFAVVKQVILPYPYLEAD